MSQRTRSAADPERYGNVRGGWWGHWVRRITHALLAVVPPAYYDLLPALAPQGVRLELWVTLLVAGGLLVFETWRLRSGVVVWGQRPYEAHRVSGAAWTIGTSIVVLVAGEALDRETARAVAYPAFITAGLADPLMGELRRLGLARWAPTAGVALAAVAWLAAWHWLEVPLVAALTIPLLTPLLEGPHVNPLDDNGTLLAVPWVCGVVAYELSAALS